MDNADAVGVVESYPMNERNKRILLCGVVFKPCFLGVFPLEAFTLSWPVSGLSPAWRESKARRCPERGPGSTLWRPSQMDNGGNERKIMSVFENQICNEGSCLRFTFVPKLRTTIWFWGERSLLLLLALIHLQYVSFSICCFQSLDAWEARNLGSVGNH